MFSGIVEEMATVVAIKHDKENIDFTLSCSFVDELSIDQSVAHNGVCLTVVEIKDGTYTVTAMKETLDRSNLGLLRMRAYRQHLHRRISSALQPARHSSCRKSSMAKDSAKS